jgi:DNA polymerase-3 subunit gamma/tau
MAYQVLARKYRPQSFDEVIGQEHVTRTLKNAIAQQRIAHGYIFSGHRGIGKTTVARILAMALNCRSTEKPSPAPCGKCDSCVEIRESRSVDVIEIDAATNRGIDEIRELREAARYRPARDRYKIYILDEAHQITDAAFNALLKTLEEPPPHVVFMMATTQPEDIPQTIRSRCQHFSFHAVLFAQIVEQLRDIAAEEKINIEDDALALVAEAGDGSMRDALSIMDQAIASSSGKLTAQSILQLVGAVPGSVLEEVMQAVAENSAEQVLRLVDNLMMEGQSPTHFARQMVRFLRNAVVAKVAGSDSALLQISSDERARVGRVAGQFSEEDLTRFLQILLRSYNDISYRADQRFHVELALLKLVHAQRLLPVEEILSGMETRAPAASPVARTAPAKPVAAASPSRVAAEETRSQPSPFEQDRARKSSGPEMSAVESPTAVAVAESETAVIHAVRQRVLVALENGGHRHLASMLQDAEWSIEGSELVVKAHAAATLLEMAMGAEPRRIATAAAAEAAGRPLRLRVESAGGNGSNKTSRSVPVKGNGPGGSGRERAADDPIVRRVQEKFGAEIRTVIDYRDKQR